MYDLSVINNKGDVLNLTGNSNYTVYKIDGLTPPAATINQSVNTTTDGSSINSVRLNNRNIVIYTTINGNVEENRINLYKYFPPKQTVTILFNNGTRDVFIEGVVEMIECDLFTSRQVAQISIVCAKPYFKAVETLVTSFSDISSLFSFPFSIEKSGVAFSELTTNIRKSIINTGDVDTGVIISLFAAGGEVVKPTIYDVQNRTKMTIILRAKKSILKHETGYSCESED